MLNTKYQNRKYKEHASEDKEAWDLALKEENRQILGLNMIASENITSRAVMEALATPLTNKYSEGYPGKRYYGGNEFIDQVENLAIERAKKLFNAEHVNVQPYSGSPANFSVYLAMLKPHDKVLGMSLAHGGHLTHGHKVNFSGKIYKSFSYGVNKEGMIDYDEMEKIAKITHPKMIVAGGSAYPRTIDFKRFREVTDSVGAKLCVDMSHFAGLVAGKAIASPIPYADIVTTTTHKTLRGPRGAMIMCKEDYANKIDKAVFPGSQGGPHNNVILAKAIAFKEAMSEQFREYARNIIFNCKILLNNLDNRMKVISEGTDTHLGLIDVTGTGKTGAEAEKALENQGIYVNKNMIPFDKRSPFDPSGIRIGTPTLTSRGMRQNEMRQIANWINKILVNNSDNEDIKKQINELCQKFPLYPKNK